jgi:MinD-like ATPase involved in chromosome partitioning or flagellar assembly
VIGHIPFDLTVTEAMVHGQPVTAYRPDAAASQAIMHIWRHLAARLDQQEGKPRCGKEIVADERRDYERQKGVTPDLPMGRHSDHAGV